MPELPYPYAPIRYPSELSVGQRIVLDREMMKAVRFRKINVKEAFTIQDSANRFFRASLFGTTREGGGLATVYEAMPASPESPAKITLVCAVLSRQRMLMVVQKATELGVVRVMPVFSERSVGPEGLAHEKAHAWPGQAFKASRQCRRASVPEVRTTVPLTTALTDPVWTEASLRFYLDDRAPRKTGQVTLPPLSPQPLSTEIVYAVGPEGGWTDAERELFSTHGATPLRLGGRVLRAETAALVGITALQLLFGDLAPR